MTKQIIITALLALVNRHNYQDAYLKDDSEIAKKRL